MRPVHCSFLSIIIKRNGDPYSVVMQTLRSHPNGDGRVECKDDLNASRALLVLEHNKKELCPPSNVVLQSLRSHPDADGRVECKDDLNAAMHCSFLCIILKRHGAPCILLLQSLRRHPYAYSRVECMDDLNASRAILVLERILFNCVRPPTVW